MLFFVVDGIRMFVILSTFVEIDMPMHTLTLQCSSVKICMQQNNINPDSEFTKFHTENKYSIILSKLISLLLHIRV
jgi:hypothetical protein